MRTVTVSEPVDGFLETPQFSTSTILQHTGIERRARLKTGTKIGACRWIERLPYNGLKDVAFAGEQDVLDVEVLRGLTACISRLE